MKPYMVRPWRFDQAADVIDRATGERVGFVLAGFVGWTAYRLDHPDLPGCPVAPGRPPYRLRRDAVEALWAARTKASA